MSFTFKTGEHWMLVFVMKILGLIVVVNLIALLILWLLRTLYLFSAVLTYEALLLLILGAFQILSSYIYREDSVPYRWGGRTAWFDFRRFARLTPEERKRYRQEGIIMVTIGLILLFGILIAHFYVLA